MILRFVFKVRGAYRAAGGVRGFRAKVGAGRGRGRATSRGRGRGTARGRGAKKAARPTKEALDTEMYTFRAKR